MLINILLIVHILVALAIIVLVLLQQGRGSDMGAAFGGGGGSQTLFGSQGSATFLSRVTAALAAVFFIGSLTLAWLYTDRGTNTSIIGDSVETESSESGDAEGLPSVDADEGEAESELPDAPDSAGDDSSASGNTDDEVPVVADDDAAVNVETDAEADEDTAASTQEAAEDAADGSSTQQ